MKFRPEGTDSVDKLTNVFLPTAITILALLFITLMRLSSVIDSFVIAHPNVFPVANFLLVVLVAGSAAHAWARSRNLVATSTRIIATSTRIDIIKPQDIAHFRQSFSEAHRIRAYNPPLTLLEETDADHRRVITSHLIAPDAIYNMIVGDEGASKLTHLYSRWETEAPDSCLQRLNVEFFEHQEKLHTHIHAWGILQEDLRGFSFFLIDYRNGCRAVLIYLLGAPFAPTFEVPQYAIRITEPVEQPQGVYAQLSHTFDTRWRSLKLSPDRRDHPMTLPDFVMRYRRRSASGAA